MPEENYAYPFDPTGTLVSNKIVGERHIINPPDYSDFYLVVPFVGPFFNKNLTVRHWPSGRELIEGTDFSLSYLFISGSRATAIPIYGGISLYDYELSGVIEITYQTIGGAWTINETKAAEMLSNVLANPRITSWEQVVDLPMTFPVIDHEWNLDDMVGATEVVEAIDEVTQAILDAQNQGGDNESHMNDTENPHSVTKTQIGLGLVANYPIASLLEAQDGVSNARYMTPLRVKEMIANRIGDSFDTHSADTDNPHNVTKVQVGLDKVENFSVATDAIARTGTSTTHYLTPHGALELIGQHVGSGVADHLTDNDNPHNVNKAQLGLGNVPNYSEPTNTIALEGTSTEHFMTPYHVVSLITDRVSAPLGDHISSNANPHNVNKVQVGLDKVENYEIATEADATDGTAIDKYMTPYTVRLEIEALVGSAGTHPSSTDNPHNVNKGQVGLGLVENYGIATTAEAVAGTSNDKYMTPLRVSEQIEDGISAELELHKTDTSNPHGVTKTQIGLELIENYGIATEVEAREGIRNDLYMTPQRVVETVDSFIVNNFGSLSNRLNTLETDGSAHHSDTDNPHNVTLTQLNAYSQTEINGFLGDKLDADGDAVNSLKLEGQTLSEILSGIQTTVIDNFVSRPELTDLTTTLTTSYEDGLWTLDNKNVISFEPGDASNVYTLASDKILAMVSNDNSIWISGGTGGLLARSIDSGLNWSSISIATSSDIISMAYIDTGMWLLGTVSGEVFKSVNEGVDWTPVTIGGTAYPILKILTNGSKVILVGSTKVQESLDNGATWETAVDLTLVSEVFDAALHSDGEVYLAGANGLHTWSTANGEVLNVEVPTSTPLHFVNIDSTDHILTVDSTGIHYRYSPINGGWQTLSYQKVINQLVVDSHDLWANVDENGLVSRSVDNGKKWAVVPTTPTTDVIHTLASSQLGWMIGGEAGLMYLSID